MIRSFGDKRTEALFWDEVVREFQGELGRSKAARDLAHAVGAFRDLGYDVGV